MFVFVLDLQIIAFCGGQIRIDFEFQAVLQNVNKAQTKIRSRKDNVAGVTLPVFECFQVMS